MQKLVHSSVAKLLYGLFFCVGLASCAAPQSDLLFKDSSLLSDGDGLIVASLGYSSNSGQGGVAISPVTMNLTVLPVSGQAAKEIFVTTLAHRHTDGAWGDSEVVRKTALGGRVLVGYRVKPGEYRLVDEYASSFDGHRRWEVAPKIVTPFKFTVASGEITYLGVHEFQILMGTNFSGRTSAVNLVIRTLNEIDDDRDTLYRVRPELRGIHINNVSENPAK